MFKKTLKELRARRIDNSYAREVIETELTIISAEIDIMLMYIKKLVGARMLQTVLRFNKENPKEMLRTDFIQSVAVSLAEQVFQEVLKQSPENPRFIYVSSSYSKELRNLPENMIETMIEKVIEPAFVEIGVNVRIDKYEFTSNAFRAEMTIK